MDALYEFVHYRVGSDRALAEDVVQDTFVIAIEKIAGFQGSSSLRTWLCGIARNLIRSARRKRRAASLPDLLEGADDRIFEMLEEIERTELPEWALQRQETAALVGATLSSLPPDYRHALLQKYVEDLSVADMGAVNGRGTKATESLLTRARVAFARVFALLSGGAGGAA